MGDKLYTSMYRPNASILNPISKIPKPIFNSFFFFSFLKCQNRCKQKVTQKLSVCYDGGKSKFTVNDKGC